MENFLNSPYIILFMIHIVLAIIVGIHIFRERNQDPTIKTLWMMIVSFFPVIGPVSYLVFGEK